jgi:hypothetical protein
MIFWLIIGGISCLAVALALIYFTLNAPFIEKDLYNIEQEQWDAYFSYYDNGNPAVDGQVFVEDFP